MGGLAENAGNFLKQLLPAEIKVGSMLALGKV